MGRRWIRCSPVRPGREGRGGRRGCPSVPGPPAVQRLSGLPVPFFWPVPSHGFSARCRSPGVRAALLLGEGEKPEEVHARGDEHGTWVALRVRGRVRRSGLGGVRGSDGFCSVRTVGAVWGHQRPHTAPNTPVPPSGGPDPGFGPTQGC